MTPVSRLVLVAVAAAVALLSGCASVTAQKVPSPAQYEKWTDEDQRKADAMEGMRYYLPRPFVNVYEPFPFATDLYIADGEVSPDGQYVVVQNVRAESPVGRFFVSPAANNVIPGVAFPTERLGRPSDEFVQRMKELMAPGGAGAKPFSSPADTAVAALEQEIASKTQAATTAADRANLAAEDATKAATASAAGAQTGQNARKVTNNNGAFAYQPLRGSMDIVYLPDFDEQYVIKSTAGLGNARFDLTLGQGWSLQGFDSQADNSELNKLVFDLIGAAATSAKAIASAGTSNIVEAIGGAAAAAIKPFSGAVAPEEVKGTKVTLRIAVVYYAAKGLYPVIKPRELKNLPRSALLLDIADDSRVGAGIRAMSDPALQAEIQRADANRSRFSIPVYPYQYISFNTFRYMSIEVLTKNGLPFGTLYSETGVSPQPDKNTPPPVAAPGQGTGEAGPDLAKVQKFLDTKKQSVLDALKAVQTDPIKAAGVTDLTSLEVDEDEASKKNKSVLVKAAVTVTTLPGVAADKAKLEEALGQQITKTLGASIDLLGSRAWEVRVDARR